MKRDSALFSILIVGLVCLVCSVVVSTSAVVLRERQDENRLLDRYRKIVEVAGLVGEGEKLSTVRINELFGKIEQRLIDLETGHYVTNIDVESYDLDAALSSSDLSRPAPANPSRIQRLPKVMKVYLLPGKQGVKKLILPIWGYGLWGTLHGYIVVERDATTVSGITYYDHKETPGLGGEVDNPWWKSRWSGRKIYDAAGNPVLSLKKPPVGTAEEDPHHVDALSGATLTGNGVTNMINFWFGDAGYKPFLTMFRQGESS